MELYILIGLIAIVLILQIVFLLKKPKSENTATNTDTSAEDNTTNSL